MNIKTAGWNATDKLNVYIGPCRCGEIASGVGFAHFVDEERIDGAWVVSDEDLFAITEAVLKARGLWVTS